MIGLNDGAFLIAGVARNCEKQLPVTIMNLSAAFSGAKSLKFLVVESDSSDKTVDALQRLALNNQNFKYITLGNLKDRYPKRTERISFCRNHYLQLLNETTEYIDIDYVVIADLDGVNSCINSEAVASCWSRSDWDVCAANQNGPYYDIWALRHPIWSPNDCWQQAQFMVNCGLSRFRSTVFSVYSKMITIPPQSEWINVESAFGGLAIYRRIVLYSVHYCGLTPQGEEICEHVSLHKKILDNDRRIFINPMLINAGIVEHTKNLTAFGLLRFWLKCQAKKFFVYQKLHIYMKKQQAYIKEWLK